MRIEFITEFETDSMVRCEDKRKERSRLLDMNRKEAEDFIYKSYLKAQKYQDYNVKDSKKRRNDLTFDLIRKKSKTPCVVITGSKGKGSVANMISQILQTKYTVGLMTSPHIVDFCERFRVNGGKISDEDFIKQISKIQDEIEHIDNSLPNNVCISPMGIQTYLALNYFEDKNTQFNIFECGKGAKYDDVNNVKHEYAVINSIFLEHTRELGETIEEIAEDKAYVMTEDKEHVISKDKAYAVTDRCKNIKDDRNIILGEQKGVYVAEQIPGVMRVIQKRADRLGVPLKVYGKDFWAENICYTKEGMFFDVVIGKERYENIVVPLLGEHQAKNCALALALCKDVLKNKDLQKEEDVLENGDLQKEEDVLENKDLQKEEDVLEDFDLIKIKENLLKLNWPGRMEVISKTPFILLDACINEASCENVLKVLKHLKIKDAVVIVGIPDDKDYAGVVRAMKNVASDIILTKSQNPHYVFTKRQQERLAVDGIYAEWTESVVDSINMAKKKEKPIVILGTTSVIGEVKKM